MQENNFNQSTAPKRNLPRDVFLHLLAIVTLYWSAVSFVTLLYQYINYFFPLPSYYYGGASQFDKFSIASLVIVFPVFLATSWYLNKIYSKEAVVRESKIRKWLIYLTLFIATLVIMGDLVTAVLYLLNGDFTVRFILKVLAILLVAGVIFSYYLDDVRKDSPTKLAKPLAFVSGVVVLVAIVGAFFIIGSPAKARLEQLDQQRVYDLQGIQSQIVSYWQRKGAMPQSLSDLNDSISGYVAPQDPQTGSPYEYTVKDLKTLSFELCAMFSADSKDSPIKPTSSYPVGPGGYDQNWDHGTGRICFERQIDEQLYPPITK